MPTNSSKLGAAATILGHVSKVAVAFLNAKTDAKVRPAPLPKGLWFKLNDAAMAQSVETALRGASVEPERRGCWVGCPACYERSLVHLMAVVHSVPGVHLLAFNRGGEIC